MTWFAPECLLMFHDRMIAFLSVVASCEPRPSRSVGLGPGLTAAATAPRWLRLIAMPRLEPGSRLPRRLCPDLPFRRTDEELPVGV
jgi:hypothetical protein